MSSFEPVGMTDLHHDVRFRQSETLYFTIRADDQRAAFLVDDVELQWNGRVFYIGERVQRRDGAVALLDIEAPALWNRLSDPRRIGNFTLDGVTAFAGLQAILESDPATGWTASLDDPDIGTDLFHLDSVDATVLNLLWKWAKITGLELNFDTSAKTVGLMVDTGANTGAAFRYGRNVTNIERRSNPPTATVLYAFGRDNLDITGTEPSGLAYVEDFTFYTGQGLTLGEARERYTRVATMRDDDAMDGATLYARAVDLIGQLAQPRVRYTLNVVDLSKLTGLAEDRVSCGDHVTATDEVFGFDVPVRVVRVDRYPLDPARSIVELAYLDPPAPDPAIGSARSNTAEEWVLFTSYTDTIRKVRAGTQTLARLDLTTLDGAQWVFGYSLQAVGVGTGTVTLEFFDYVSGATIWPSVILSVTPGSAIVENFTFGQQSIGAAEWSIRVRAHSSGAGVGMDVGTTSPTLPAADADAWLGQYAQTLLLTEIG